MSSISVVLVLIFVCTPVMAQTVNPRVAEARAAISKGEFSRAVSILVEETRVNPSADAYVYLGIAYGNMKEYSKAEETLLEGARRYSSDPRFHNELAGTYLARNERSRARDSLRDALEIDPANDYAADLLANIDMSEGNVHSALDFWNRNGRPVVSEILHNRYPGFGHWTVEKAVAFEPNTTLRYRDWLTTERRLFATKLYANVGLDIEPTAQPGQYDVDIRTTLRKTNKADLMWGVVRGLPFQTTYLDLWNIGESGLSLNSFYRWQPERRRVDSVLRIPVPLPGILFVDLQGVWRNEEWDISEWTIFGSPLDQFRYKSTGGQILFRHIPSYRVEIAGGIEYRNRAITLDVDDLSLNHNNTGKLLGETTITLWERGENKGRLLAGGYLARRFVLSDLDYSGGVTSLQTSWQPNANPRNSVLTSITAGTTRGRLPIDDYFVLGVQPMPEFLLRAHSVTRNGVSGASPLGSAFILSNTTIAREVKKIPTFNAANLPFISVKGEFFIDIAKVYDRARIFRQDDLFVDLGVGLQFASPTNAFHLIFGQSVTDGRRALTAYVEKTW